MLNHTLIIECFTKILIPATLEESTGSFCGSIIIQIITYGVLIGVVIYTRGIIQRFSYNTRESLELREFFPEAFADRAHRLDKASEKIIKMNFVKAGKLYLEMKPEIISYIFKHRTQPCYLILSNLDFLDEGMNEVSLMSFFDKNVTLLTTQYKEIGDYENPKNSLLQIFPNTAHNFLVDSHMDTLKYLKKQGYTPLEKTPEELRKSFMRRFQDCGKYVKSQPGWFFKVLIWKLSGHWKKYSKTIEEQHAIIEKTEKK